MSDQSGPVAIEVTEVIIQLHKPKNPNNKILAFVRVTINNAITVTSIKLLRTSSGGIMVIMPDRKRSSPCGECFKGNPVDGFFCSYCGSSLGFPLATQKHAPNEAGLYFSNICYPISSEARKVLEDAIISEYEAITGKA